MERLLADLRLTRASDFHLSLLKKTSRCPYARARRYRGAVASACLVPGVRRRVPCALAPARGDQRATADWIDLAAICIWAAKSPRDLSRLSTLPSFGCRA